MEIIQLKNMNPEDLGSLIKSILKEEFERLFIRLQVYCKNSNDEFLTRKEAAKFLRTSETNLWSLDKKQILPAKRLNGKVLYLKSDLINFQGSSAKNIG